jgi:hypothetical protein
MNELPKFPRLVLRAGFAGSKDLDPATSGRLRTQLQNVYAVLGRALAEIAPGVPVVGGKEPAIARFYSNDPPLLRLVTGLCEGADAQAAEVLSEVEICAEPPNDTANSAQAQMPQGAPSAVDQQVSERLRETGKQVCLQTELAAVLPFAVADYRASRPKEFHQQFDQQLERCAYVLELDGIYAKPDPDTTLAKARRARAYRAQSAFLLRHCDVLIAATNPNDPGKAGGTLETVRSALAFELPVIFLHTGSGAVYLLDPAADLPTALTDPAPSDWRTTLAEWVRQIVADPDLAESHGGAHSHGESHHPTADVTLLDEYFKADPPEVVNINALDSQPMTSAAVIMANPEAFIRQLPRTSPPDAIVHVNC